MVIVYFFVSVLLPYQMVSVFTGYGLWDRKHIWFRIKTIKVNGKSPLWQKNKYVPACALSGQCYDDCLCISHSGSSHYFALIISTAHVHIHIHTQHVWSTSLHRWVTVPAGACFFPEPPADCFWQQQRATEWSERQRGRERMRGEWENSTEDRSVCQRWWKEVTRAIGYTTVL